MIPSIVPTPLDTVATGLPDAAADRRVVLDPELRPAFVAHGEAVHNLERLFSTGALCITTGQQPGLFTGPLLTVHKALSAVALARRWEAVLDRPVVPLFWVAGDDHDFAESNHCYLLGGNHAVERITLRDRRPDAPSTPMYRERLGADVTSAIDRITALTPDTEFRATILEWLTTHYRPDATVAGAFGDALAELLGRFGLVVFQPTHVTAKRAMAPHLLAALDRWDALEAGLRSRADALEAAGAPVRVPVRPGETLVMVEGTRGRDRLLADGECFHTRRAGERWSLDALRALAADDPQRLSPNVLLRPVIEAALLPTVAYVAGPGERQYLDQTSPIYDLLGIPAQRVVTRWSGRVVERRIEKILTRYGIEPDDLLGPEGQLEARLVRDAVPDDAAQAIEALRQSLATEYDRLIDAAVALDPTLRKPATAAQQRALRDVAGVEKRLISHLKTRNETLVRQLEAARAAVFPRGQPQERVLNVLQYLVRYGGDYLFGVLAACEEWASGQTGER